MFSCSSGLGQAGVNPTCGSVAACTEPPGTGVSPLGSGRMPIPQAATTYSGPQVCRSYLRRAGCSGFIYAKGCAKLMAEITLFCWLVLKVSDIEVMTPLDR